MKKIYAWVLAVVLLQSMLPGTVQAKSKTRTLSERAEQSLMIMADQEAALRSGKLDSWEPLRFTAEDLQNGIADVSLYLNDTLLYKQDFAEDVKAMQEIELDLAKHCEPETEYAVRLAVVNGKGEKRQTTYQFTLSEEADSYITAIYWNDGQDEWDALNTAGYTFEAPPQVTIYTADKGFRQEIVYYLEQENGTKSEPYYLNAAQGVFSFPLPSGFTGRLYAAVSSSRREEIPQARFVVSGKVKVKEDAAFKEKITVQLPPASFTAADGSPLYAEQGETMPIDIDISNFTAGITKLEWEIKHKTGVEHGERSALDFAKAEDWKIQKQEQGRLSAISGQIAVYAKEGKNQLHLRVTDRIGRQSDETVTFYVDTHAPKWENGFADSFKSMYTAYSRRLLLRLTEEQFDVKRVSVQVKRNGIVVPTSLQWEEEAGNCHSAALDLREEGRYEIVLQAQDRAGHCSEKQTYYAVIDRQPPQLTVEGLDAGSSLRQATPITIRANDAASAIASISAMLVDSAGCEIPLPDPMRFMRNEVVLRVDSILRYTKADGSYQLVVEAWDHAGNKQRKTVPFHVNRNGSHFEAASSFLTFGIYWNEAGSFIFTEKNIDPLCKHSLLLRHNDETRLLQKGSDYDVILRQSNENQYEYVLSSSLFQNDGIYSVYLYSFDQAGNWNISSKQAPMTFGIDRSRPSITALNLKHQGTYEGAVYEAKFLIRDNMELAKVSFLLNGKELEYSYQNGYYRVQIPAAKQQQQLQVQAWDQAGNTEVFHVEDFRVQQPYYKMNLLGVLLYGGSGMILLAALSVSGYRVRKKKKGDDSSVHRINLLE